MLNDIVFALPLVRASVKKIGSCLNLKKADENKRVLLLLFHYFCILSTHSQDELWNDPDKYPEVDDMKMASCLVDEEAVILILNFIGNIGDRV